MRALACCTLLAIAACYDGKAPALFDGPRSDAIADATHDGVRDASSADARPDSALADASLTPTLGRACTGTGQGSCPTGFECLNLQGGSGSWCSAPCSKGAGDTCDQGYTGPGVGSCILSVTPAGGGQARTYCAIICQDEPGSPTLCNPASRCATSCPAPLQCRNELRSEANAIVGRLCD